MHEVAFKFPPPLLSPNPHSSFSSLFLFTHTERAIIVHYIYQLQYSFVGGAAIYKLSRKPLLPISAIDYNLPFQQPIMSQHSHHQHSSKVLFIILHLLASTGTHIIKTSLLNFLLPKKPSIFKFRFKF